MSTAGLTIQNAGSISTNGDQSKLLYQVPTLMLSENSPAGGTDFTGIQAVNIFGGTPTQGPLVIINAATLLVYQVITFVNTSLRPSALRLSNGNVGGSTVYILQPGQITFQFDGTNLN